MPCARAGAGACQSTKSPKRHKSADTRSDTRPRKLYNDFSFNCYPTGRFSRKIRDKVQSFGRWGDRKDGGEARCGVRVRTNQKRLWRTPRNRSRLHGANRRREENWPNGRNRYATVKERLSRWRSPTVRVAAITVVARTVESGAVTVRGRADSYREANHWTIGPNNRWWRQDEAAADDSRRPENWQWPIATSSIPRSPLGGCGAADNGYCQQRKQNSPEHGDLLSAFWLEVAQPAPRDRPARDQYSTSSVPLV